MIKRGMMKYGPYEIEKITGQKWRKKKSYRYLYRLICRRDVLRAAFFRMRKKKTKRIDIREVAADLEAWIDRMQLKLINTKPPEWKVEFPDMAFRPPKHKPVYRKERGKVRETYEPTLEELWIQHAIILILEPIIYGSSYPHSYSSFPKRGGLRGKNTLARWIRSGKGIRNFAQCDIRHFYAHIRRDVIMKALSRRIHDRMFLYLIEVCLTWFPKMLPLGFFLSQWFANYLLQALDFGLKCVVKVAHVLRYLDNITLADDSKKKLHAAILYIRRFLGRYKLRMKNDWQVFRFEYVRKDGSITGRPVSAMGWVFHRNRTTLRKNNILHLSRVTQRLYRRKKEKKKFPLRTCRSFSSLMGWVRHADVYNWYLDRVKPYVRYKTVRKIISKKDKEDAKNARMAEGAVLRAT